MPEVQLALTERQSRFVREYLVDGNGTRAAVAAGYGRPGARVTACRLLTKPNVRALLGARQSADEERLGVDRNRVVAEFLRAAQMAQEQGSPTGMIAAWREVGKMLGFYAPVVTEVNATFATTGLLDGFKSLPDDALEELIMESGSD